MSDPVTEMGGQARSFPNTSWGLVLNARHPFAPELRDHFEILLRNYWKPVYWIIRVRWNRPNEEAKDLTQQFFTEFFEKDRLQAYSPERGRFRVFVRASLENFMRNDLRDQRRLKRGGERQFLSLDLAEAPIFELSVSDESPERAFDQAWACALIQDGVQTLRRQYTGAGQERAFRIFEAHDLAKGEPPSYADLSQKFETTEDTVRGALRRVRADLRAFLRDRVLATLLDPADLEAEMNYLFGNEAAGHA
jgi:RNA polymerase sigma-70 factor (ECF subfamily)